MGKLINKNIQHLCDDSDGYMSLYSVGDPTDSGKKPIIFIRGHAGKYTINTKSILDHPIQNSKLMKQSIFLLLGNLLTKIIWNVVFMNMIDL